MTRKMLKEGEEMKVWISDNPTIGRIDRTYHDKSDCRYFRKVPVFRKKLIDLSEAEKRGHTPCSNCAAIWEEK